MKFSTKDFCSKCDHIRRKLRIRSHLLEKSLMGNFIFCAACLKGLDWVDICWESVCSGSKLDVDMTDPADTGRKLNVPKTFRGRPWTPCERLTYLLFTSCVYRTKFRWRHWKFIIVRERFNSCWSSWRRSRFTLLSYGKK